MTDGIGAYGISWQTRVTYNDCEVAGDIPDGQGPIYATICDDVSRNGDRVRENCNSMRFVT